jgi:hypothetical protein
MVCRVDVPASRVVMNRCALFCVCTVAMHFLVKVPMIANAACFVNYRSLLVYT